jgi:hypothetical protein
LRLAAATVCALLLAGLGATFASPASAKVRTCGTVQVSGSRYLIKIEHGPATCYVAKAVLKRFIVRGSAQKLWFCFRGHSAQKWAAACSKGRAIIRAYVKS